MDVDETLPETVKAFLRKGAKLENITLHADGKWTHEGLDFENQNIIDAFFRGVNRTVGGTWVITLEPFTYPIEVEECGYFVRRVEMTPDLKVFLSDGTTEIVPLSSIHYRPPSNLYCTIKEGRFEARFLRQPHNQLLEHVVEDSGSYVLELGNERVVLQDSTPES